MGNPFIHSKAATGSDFVGHQAQLQLLVRNFKQHRHTLVQAPHGWGKTSLVKESINRLNESEMALLPCWVDCLAFRSEQTFYQALIQSIAQHLAKDAPWHQLASKFLQQAAIPFSFRTQEQSFVLELFDLNQHYAEVLDVIEQLAKEQGVHLLICLDNFEALSHVSDPIVLSQRLRSIWQHHHHVTYCFMARPSDFAVKLFESNPASFHSFGEIVQLPKLEASLLADFIQEKFQSSGKDLEGKHALAIVNRMQSHLYYVQQLAHTVWMLTEKKVLGTTIIQGLETMLGRQAILFERIIDEISNSQFNFLKALASGVETGFTKQRVIHQFELGSSANVVKVQKALVKKEVIQADEDEIQFLDPAFALWFKWNILK